MAEAALPILIGGAASAARKLLSARNQQQTRRSSPRASSSNGSIRRSAMSSPLCKAARTALNLYNNATGVNGSAAQQSYYNNFQNDPGFQASVNYGLQQLQAQNAAQGMGLSGNTLAALQSYSQNALSKQYQTRLRIFSRARSSAQTQPTH